MIQCDNEQCETVGAVIASRAIENSCLFWMRLDGLLWNVSPWRFYSLPRRYPKKKKSIIFLNIARSLLAWIAVSTWNLKPGKTFTFLLESDTGQCTKSFAKIWWTFLWISENFTLGLKPETKHISRGVRFHSDQLTRFSLQVVFIISCLQMREKD